MRKPFRILFNLNFLYMILIAAQVAAIVFFCLCLPAVLPAMLVLAAEWLLTVLTAVLLLTRDGGAEAKCAWFALIAALPVAGAVLYLLCALKKEERGILEVTGANPSAPLARAANLQCGSCEAGYERAIYFKDGSEFFQTVLQEIGNAKNRIFLEFYILAKGKVFDSTLEALKNAAARGVKIRILIDGLGSAFKAGKREIKALKSIAEVQVFHPLLPLPLSRQNLRDHRKIVTVDGQIAFTGGFNLSDEYARLTRPYGDWKDSGIAVYGNAAKIFEGMFLAMWEGEYRMSAPGRGQYNCIPFYDSPPRRSFYEDAVAYAVDCARERIHAFTPYFCIPERLAASLAFAARRGVDVKIILPHIPDKRSVFAISKACAATLTDGGVQFFEYTPGFMHAKCLICDNSVFLGSYNLDFRSMHYNYECGVLFYGELAEEAERDFCDCLALSQPLNAGNPTPVKKFIRFFSRLFAPLV